MWGYVIGVSLVGLFLLIIYYSSGSDNEDSLDDPEVMGSGPNSDLNEVAAAPMSTREGNLVKVMAVCNCRKHKSGKCRKRKGRCRLRPGFYRCKKSGCNPVVSGMGNVGNLITLS